MVSCTPETDLGGRSCTSAPQGLRSLRDSHVRTGRLLDATQSCPAWEISTQGERSELRLFAGSSSMASYARLLASS